MPVYRQAVPKRSLRAERNRSYANHPKDENPYILDAESAAEMTRLLQQDQLLTKGIGGLLPAQIDPAQIHDVLDIGCGPGGWVRDVAFTYPEMEVTGFDLAPRIV